MNPRGVPSRTVGMPPASLTAGLPDPKTIAKQKEAYLKMLEDQLRQGIMVLDAEVKVQRSYIVAQADQQKKEFIMQVDMDMTQQDVTLQRHYAEQALALHIQAAKQKSDLEQQAMQLTMEYQAKKQEEIARQQQYEIECAQREVSERIMTEMGRLGVTTYALQSFVPGLGRSIEQASSQIGLPSHRHPPSASVSQSPYGYSNNINTTASPCINPGAAAQQQSRIFPDGAAAQHHLISIPPSHMMGHPLRGTPVFPTPLLGTSVLSYMPYEPQQQRQQQQSYEHQQQSYEQQSTTYGRTSQYAGTTSSQYYDTSQYGGTPSTYTLNTNTQHTMYVHGPHGERVQERI